MNKLTYYLAYLYNKKRFTFSQLKEIDKIDEKEDFSKFVNFCKENKIFYRKNNEFEA
jgi:hypothetical protein